jgi:hypothetical protein
MRTSVTNSGSSDGTAGALPFGRSQVTASMKGSGFAAPERSGCWTDGPVATITFELPSKADNDLLFRLTGRPFVWKEVLTEQLLTISVNRQAIASWHLFDPTVRTRVFFVPREVIGSQRIIEFQFELPLCAAPASFGINTDNRRLGFMLHRLEWQPVDGKPDPSAPVWQSYPLPKLPSASTSIILGIMVESCPLRMRAKTQSILVIA